MTTKHWYESSTIWGIAGQLASSSGLLGLAMTFLLEVPINPELKAALLGALGTSSVSTAALALRGRWVASGPLGSPTTPAAAAPPEPLPVEASSHAIEPPPRELEADGPLEPTGEPDLEEIRRLPSAENVGGQLDLGLGNLEGKWKLVALQTSRLKSDVDGTKHVPIAKGDEVRAESIRYDDRNQTHWVLKLSTPVNGGIFYAFHEHWEVWNSEGTREGFAWDKPSHVWS